MEHPFLLIGPVRGRLPQDGGGEAVDAGSPEGLAVHRHEPAGSAFQQPDARLLVLGASEDEPVEPPVQVALA